jgi:UDP-N-acetylmuramate--alanine ligase
VYEGLHNTRQHFIKEDLRHLFDSVKKLYVVPSYLAREDESLALLSPQDIINLTSKPSNGVASQLNADLKHAIQQHITAGNLVLCLSAGGGTSLDEWLRIQFHD